MAATVTWKGDEWMQTVGIPAANEAVAHAADVGAQIVRKSLGTNHGGTRSKPGSPPHTQSNFLRSTIRHVGPAKMGDLKAQVGTSARYARQLEFGGTIRAKGGALVYPLNKAAEKFVNKGSASGYPAAMRSVLNALKFKYTGNRRLVWMPSKKGGVTIAVMDKGGKGGKGSRVLLNEPMFRMAKSVTIQARPFMRPLRTNPDNRSAIAKAAQARFAESVAKRSVPGRAAA